MNCILCGEKKLEVLTRKLRNNEPGIVRYCPECDLGILEDNLSPEEIRRWYEGDYRKSHKLMPDKEYADYQIQRVNLLMPYLNMNTVLLDVGCSGGHFLRAVQSFVKKAVGVDCDSTTVIPGELFDVITVMHVLEHTYDPISFLEMIKENLKPNGMVYIEVPNMNDIINVVYGSEGFKDVLFHRAHRWYFTPKSLAKTMEKVGFSGTLLFLNMYNVLNHMSWASTDKPIDTKRAIGKPILPMVEDVPEDIKHDLQEWIIDVNTTYGNILSTHGISGEIGFIGYD